MVEQTIAQYRVLSDFKKTNSCKVRKMNPKSNSLRVDQTIIFQVNFSVICIQLYIKFVVEMYRHYSSKQTTNVTKITIYKITYVIYRYSILLIVNYIVVSVEMIHNVYAQCYKLNL